MTQRSTPPRTRRRGATLEDALYTAALAELAAHGYAALSMEGVAARAHTGKAALYRRWPSKRELVLAALRHAMPVLPDPGPDQSARANLMAVFTALCDVLAGSTPMPGISMAADMLREPGLRASFTDELLTPRLQTIETVLRRGVDTGEIDPSALGPLTARTGPALILQTILLTGEPPSPHELETIVNTVLGAP
ncbi:MAG: TetR/AcrR family transcriptional regulator [Nocardioidaceae bacterium]